MKKFIKLTCLLLALAMTLPMIFACKKEDENTDDASNGSVSTEDGIAGIPKQNYGTDFTIIYPNAGLFVDYYWAEEIGSSSISKANYEREMAIEEHLGIEIYYESFEQNQGVLNSMLEHNHLAGLDEYQLSMTHCFQDLVTVMSAGYLTDLTEVSGISMNEEYWNVNIMNSIKFQGHTYLGSSSFILHTPTVVLFNKDMANALQGVSADKMYEHVREKTWTIEQMRIYASMADISENASLTDPLKGTYGYVSDTNWELCGFVTASGYYHVTTDNDGKYQLRDFNNSIYDIFKEVVAMTDSNYYFGWDWAAKENEKISMSSGQAFFGTVGTDDMIKAMINTNVHLGVLPYPTIEKDMDYLSLDWAGYFCIPSVVSDKKLSGEVVELFSYLGKTKVETEYYDVLLGLRASDEPQDSEMLELIFDNLTIEPALTFLNAGESALSSIFYTIPYMILNNQKAMASWYASNYRGAANMLNQVNAVTE